MTDLTKLTLAQARKELIDRNFSAVELTDAYLAAIEAANPKLNAYVAVTSDSARHMAKASDERLAAGQGRVLEGIPLGIKDLFGTRGVHTQAASHILDGFKPEYESTVTANLWGHGAVMLGKLNMDEFAMGSSNETSYYGPVVNPWRSKGSNAQLVRSVSADPVDSTWIAAKIVAVSAVRMNSAILTRATGTPRLRAAVGSPPTAKIQLP